MDRRPTAHETGVYITGQYYCTPRGAADTHSLHSGYNPFSHNDTYCGTTVGLARPSRQIDRSRRQLRSNRARAAMDRRHWVTVTWLFFLLATLALLGGYIAPMWLWLQSSDGTNYFGIGLWYYVGCRDANCVPNAQGKFDTNTGKYYYFLGWTVSIDCVLKRV